MLKSFKIVDGLAIVYYKFKQCENYKEVSFNKIRLPITTPNVYDIIYIALTR